MEIYIKYGSFIISIGSLIISIIVFIISLLTKKYELAFSQRQELLSWYSDTVEHLIRLREKAADADSITTNELAHLSMLIEKGRFYFPNIDRKDGHGINKPTAYRGHRQAVLTFLVFSYDIFERKDSSLYFGHALRLQKLFTAKILNILSPKIYTKSVKKYTGTNLYTNITFKEFLESDPQKYYLEEAY